MSDEMVKKARAHLKATFQERWKNANPDSQMSREDQECWVMASFARSAVRDALDEAIATVKKLPRSFSNIATPSSVCAKAVNDLSALRKKFEVEG